MTESELVAAGIAAERALLEPSFGADKSTVERILALGFTEVGQSDRARTREETVHALLSEPHADVRDEEMTAQWRS